MRQLERPLSNGLVAQTGTGGAGALACGPAPPPVHRPKTGQGAGRGPGGSPYGWILIALVAMAGCGYHVGNADLLPKSLKTIAVPAFANVTTRYDLARMLPEDIAREFLSRTRYRVVADPAQADAVLTGSVVRFTSYPTTADASGRATAVQASVILQLTLRDRVTGAVLFSRPSFEFRERYAISVSPEDYFDESGVAMMRLSQQVAASMVTAILQNF